MTSKRRHLDIYTTTLRHIHVVTTSCACWEGLTRTSQKYTTSNNVHLPLPLMRPDSGISWRIVSIVSIVSLSLMEVSARIALICDNMWLIKRQAALSLWQVPMEGSWSTAGNGISYVCNQYSLDNLRSDLDWKTTPQFRRCIIWFPCTSLTGQQRRIKDHSRTLSMLKLPRKPKTIKKRACSASGMMGAQPSLALLNNKFSFVRFWLHYMKNIYLSL